MQWPQDPMFYLTLCIVVLAGLQAAIYYRMLRLERPWVSLEALAIEPAPDGSCYITVGLRNSGRTPARITAANVTVRSHESVDGSMKPIEQLSDKPAYDEDTVSPPPILVAGEVSCMRIRVSHVGERGTFYGLRRLRPGDSGPLWVYGYVRYKHALGIRTRRYGWVREYDPVLSKARDAISFAHVNKPHYSYAD